MNTKKKIDIHRLTFSGVMIALAAVLALVCALIPFLQLPYGGTLTLASMLPIIIVSYVYGMKWGFFTSFTYAVLQILMDLMMGKNSTIIAYFLPEDEGGMKLFAAIAITLIDYIIAYGVLGIGGAFRKSKNRSQGLFLGAIVATTFRYIAHIISGFIFWGAYAEWFFTETFNVGGIGDKILSAFDGKMLALVYSVIYNGLYMIPEIILTAIVALVIARLPQLKAKEF